MSSSSSNNNQQQNQQQQQQKKNDSGIKDFIAGTFGGTAGYAFEYFIIIISILYYVNNLQN